MPATPEGRGQIVEECRCTMHSSDGETKLAGYQPLHAAHAELLRRAGDRPGADEAYARAIELSGNAVERAELARRRDELAG